MKPVILCICMMLSIYLPNEEERQGSCGLLYNILTTQEMPPCYFGEPTLMLKKVENQVVENQVVENQVVENQVIENQVVENQVIENQVVENQVIENQVIKNQVIENTKTEHKKEVKKQNISAMKALDLVKERYAANFTKVYDNVGEEYYYKLSFADYYLVYEGKGETEKEYLIHLYEFVIDEPEEGIGHTVTYGWFTLDSETGEITEQLQ